MIKTHMKEMITIGVLMSALLGCGNDADIDYQQSGALALSICARDITGEPPAVNGAECGMLSVLENPADPAGKKIALNVLRWPAISPGAEADPLFVIAGGPGQAATEIAAMLAPILFEVRKNRDIVFVDQRGTGKSNPMHCGQDEAASWVQTSLEAQSASKKIIRACAEKYAAQAPFYTTPFTVVDLELVRKSLGYKRINLWGASYGTRVILEYMAQYPEVLRTTVMDGVAPVQLALPAFTEIDAYSAFEKVADICSSNKNCKRRYGDLLVKAQSVSETLASAPVQIDFLHPLTEQTTAMLIDNMKFASLLRFALYDRYLAQLLPRVVAATFDENYTLLASLVTQVFGNKQLQGIAQGMHVNILCNEDRGFLQPLSNISFFGLGTHTAMRDVCALWPHTPLPERFYLPIASDVPSLLLSGALDPVTPPYWAEKVLPGLSQGLHVVASGAHHGVTAHGCTAKVIANFIEAGTTAALDTHCIEVIRPFPPYVGVMPND